MDYQKSFFVEIFNKIFKKHSLAETNIYSNKQFSLTPSTIEKIDENGKENKGYKTVIDIAEKLLEKDVKNIAITGPFGSGKSSILLTLQKDYPQYNYLNISLATLDSYKQQDTLERHNIELSNIQPKLKKSIENNPPYQEENNGADCKSYQDKEESWNRLIEYSILQQLIYKERISDIPQSRFKRIKHVSQLKSRLFSVGTVLLIFACCILFDPNLFRIQSLHNLFLVSKYWKIFWDIICLTYIIVFSIYTIRWLIVNTYNSKLNKLNIKDGEIDIAESTSIFNKHLDEIIYFFEVTKYDVVIIEDLDRFKTHNIFLKLRELNQLINNSKEIHRYNNRQIVFIYALRDDIFNDTSRTKFFDYITTIIPVINPSNSRDKLKLALIDQGINDITDDVCMDLGIFIDDMRILKNIVNEYTQYRYKLDEKLKPEKILAMILYKNYHPDDFAQLHNQSGIVFQTLKNKVKYHNTLVQQRDNEIATLQEELKQITHFYSTQKEKELRTLYVMKYIQKIGSIQRFNDQQSTQITVSQLIEDRSIFQKLANNELSVYSPNHGSFIKLSFTFQDIEKEIDPKQTYKQRLGMTSTRVEEINSEIARLQQEIADYRTLPMHRILSKYPAEDFFLDVKEIQLIAFLLRQGYIDENYYDYISYFYPGTMTASDRDFVLNIKIGLKQEYNYQINKPKAVLEQISDSAFANGTMLNFDLIDYLVSNKELYITQLILIIRSIKRNKVFSFIEAYYQESKQGMLFFYELLPQWNDFFKEGILKIKNPENEGINFEIILKYFPKSNVEHYKNLEFKNYITGKFDFIFSKLGSIGIENVKFLIKTIDVKFTRLQVKDQISEEFMNFVIEGNYYVLSNENISLILGFINHDLAEQYIYSSYSAIIKSENQTLITYINENISECIISVFSRDSIHENENSLITLVENDDIEAEAKNNYLSCQTNKISNLSSIDQAYWEIAIKTNLIVPIWKNIEEYISVDSEAELPPPVLVFISNNSTELGQQKTSGAVSDSTLSRLFIQLIGSNLMQIESYRKIIKAFNRQFNSFDLSSLHIDRIEILIENGCIKFNEYNYNIITKVSHVWKC